MEHLSSQYPIEDKFPSVWWVSATLSELLLIEGCRVSRLSKMNWSATGRGRKCCQQRAIITINQEPYQNQSRDEITIQQWFHPPIKVSLVRDPLGTFNWIYIGGSKPISTSRTFRKSQSSSFWVNSFLFHSIRFTKSKLKKKKIYRNDFNR